MVAINSDPVEGMTFAQVMAKLKSAARPLTITFRPDGVQEQVVALRRASLVAVDDPVASIMRRSDGAGGGVVLVSECW